jgi:hypothetical protein
LPAGFGGLDFFRDAGRSGAFLATFFRIVPTLLTVFVRVPLLTGIFLRVALALPFAFFLVAIAASLTPTAFRLWIAPHYPPKALKEKEKKTVWNRRRARAERTLDQRVADPQCFQIEK